MAELEPVVDALADRLSTLPEMQTYVEPPGTVDAPAIAIALGDVTYDTSMDRDSDDVDFTLDLFVTDGGEGLRNLYGYTSGSGESSVKACLEDEPTLGGLVMDITVTNAQAPDRATVGEGQFIHVRFFGKLVVSGST
jgi:hypothetical protein